MMVGTRLGTYLIEAQIGAGGMGVVYRATDLALDVPVALKLLRPELATRADAFERFRQELLMARQVSSPYVVRIHDLAQHEGQWLAHHRDGGLSRDPHQRDRQFRRRRSARRARGRVVDRVELVARNAADQLTRDSGVMVQRDASVPHRAHC